MKHCALQTVSSKSKSIPDKNIYHTSDGHPLYWHNLNAAKKSGIYNDIYIISDYAHIGNGIGRRIREDTSKYKTDGNHHYESILQGLEEIEKAEGKLDYLTILLGNNRGATWSSLKEAYHFLRYYSEYDSCVSVSKFNMFNPYRAFKCKNGKLCNWVDPEIIKQNQVDLNDKNAFDDTYFFNGSFWMVKRDVLVANNGIPPFTWLGNNILPYIQDEGIMELDAPWQLRNII